MIVEAILAIAIALALFFTAMGLVSGKDKS